MNKVTKFIAVLSVALILVSALGCNSGGKMQSWKTPPTMQIDKTKNYTAVFDTSFGSFEIELFAAAAPNTVNNFVFLARQGFYDDTVFHRILKEFVIQGGDPGAGGPGYKFDDELSVLRPYEAGIVAMANAGANTNGSQFFICTGYRSSSLDSIPNYTQFGRVISGMDVVLKIDAAPVAPIYDSQGNVEMSKPLNPPKINKVTIIES